MYSLVSASSVQEPIIFQLTSEAEFVVDSKIGLLILLERIGSAHMVSYLAFWNTVESIVIRNRVLERILGEA